MDFNPILEKLEKRLIEKFKRENPELTFLTMQLIDFEKNGLVNQYKIEYFSPVTTILQGTAYEIEVYLSNDNFYIELEETQIKIYSKNKRGDFKILEVFAKNNDYDDETLELLANHVTTIPPLKKWNSTIKTERMGINDIDLDANPKNYSDHIKFFKCISEYQTELLKLEQFKDYKSQLLSNSLSDLSETNKSINAYLDVLIGVYDYPVEVIYQNENFETRANLGIYFKIYIESKKGNSTLDINIPKITSNDVVAIETLDLKDNISVKEPSRIKELFNIDLSTEEEEPPYKK